MISHVPYFAITQVDKEKNTITLIPIKTPVQSLEEQSAYIKAKAELDYALHGQPKTERASYGVQKGE